jgi:predicted TIM-barrel fold metal-dependent hydrolase
MKITDAQVHIWAANSPERPWPQHGRAHPHRDTPFSHDDLLREMDAAGVARAIIVPPSWEGERNDLAIDACSKHPDRFAIMGRIAPDPSNLPALETWRNQPGMMGLRFTYRPDHQGPEDGSSDWLWREVERVGLPLMISCAGQVRTLGRLAERFPGLRLIVDHLALRRSKDAEAFADLPDLLALARLPNVAAKASALPSYSSDSYPYRNLHGYLRQVFDAFGPRRTFWGTDLTRLDCSYRQAVTMFTEELPWLSDADKEWVMGRGVSEFIGWEGGAG